ncbi:hypothetical protein ACOCJ7_05305 [Knoellia sp. CPCC 206453]|uniref:hypothetical protein n=1 Tax=Knoellia pratensis TaxID=3404796 RepID=UPI00361CF2CE
MRRTPKPDRDSAAGRFNGWVPDTTRMTDWGAVALIALALVWALLAPDATVRPTPSDPPVTAEDARDPVVADRPEPDCATVDRPQEPPPAGFAAVSTSLVSRDAIMESIRWAQNTREGLWGVAAVAECDAARLDAVWTDPNGARRRHNVSPSGRPVIGVVADGPDGAISVYSVRGTSTGSISVLLHISTDRGATWQEREVPRSGESYVRAGVLPASWKEWSVVAN